MEMICNHLRWGSRSLFAGRGLVVPRSQKRATEQNSGAGFRDKTHIQICVREPEQIMGFFRIPDWHASKLNYPAFRKKSE